MSRSRYNIFNIITIFLGLAMVCFLLFLVFYINLDLKTIVFFLTSFILFIILFRYPEISFGLFLIAGFFKADPRLQEVLPNFFDLTIFFGAIVVLSILYKTLKRKLKIPRIPSKLFLPYIILVALMFASLFYTQAPVYGWDKFLRFITITTLAIFGPLFLFTDIKKFHRFLYTLLFISSLMTIESIISSCGATWGFHAAFGSNYLALGRITGIVSLVIIYYFLMKKPKSKVSIIWFLLLALNLFGLLYSGARAPVIAFFIAIIILGLISLAPKIRLNRFKIIKIAVVFVLLGIMLFILAPQPFSTLFARIKVLYTQEGGGSSMAGRLSAYNSAIKAFRENPIQGLGLGGFSVYRTGIDQRIYPHNIFLEISSEMGIIGLTPLLFLIGFCFFYLLKLKKNYKGQKYYLIIMTMSLFVFMFLNVQISGDINDNRLFFVWIGTAYALGNILKLQNQRNLSIKKYASN